ncbi:MAG: hypothetical protein LQ344_003914 [Seirophora lacunosa]|nr:MAG: hypothetical protein LQ344_003914 [Seirophora lacunosa]
MAPRKRPSPDDRADEDESEGYEVVDGESAQSNLRQDPKQRKRPRVSYRDSSDRGSEAPSEDDVVFQEQETQFHTQQRSNNQSSNTAADNGILESVSCTNFMCHSYLEVALGPLINFIIGHNGSGKSAVLTAITICLGGKATATNRGQSLKSFIKEGTEAAVLSVKIKNKGESSYQNDVYGDAIIVERHFTRSGTSSFKLKSSLGRLISTKKADLEEICDYFALQIDNPMNVLTQDMARQFLSNSTPQEKYKFFMKGTQLEHLDGDYLQIEGNLDIIDQGLATILADLGQYEEAARKAKATLAMSEKHESLRTKITNMSQQMAWSQVEEQEQKLAKADEELVKITDKITNARQKADECSESYDAADRGFREADGVVKDLQLSLAPHDERKEEAKEEHDKAKADAMTVQTEQRSIKDHMKQSNERIKRAENDIQEELRRLEEVNGGSNARLLAEIEEKRAVLAEARTRMDDHDGRLQNLEEEQRHALQNLERSKEPIPRQRKEVQECEERLNRLARDKGRQEGAYHANLPRLLRAIREDGGFRETPVGPLGYHVRLLKPSWSGILEKSFGATLNTFIVTSKPDQIKLSEVMNRCQCQCPIMIGNNGPVDTSGHEPDPKFDTSLRVLEIDNDLVRKQLIINQMIEQTMLHDDRKEAVNLMSDSRLPNVKQCFTPNKNGAGSRYSYGWGGNLMQNYIPAYKGTPRMKTDVEFQISDCRSELQRLRNELNDLERTQRERQTNVKNCEQAIVRHKRETRELRIEVQKLEGAVADIQDRLDNGAVEEGRLDALKQGLEDAKEELSTHQASFGDSVIAKDKATEVLKTLRDRMSAIDVETANIKAKIQKAEVKSVKVSERRDAALRDKNSAYAAIKQQEDAYEVAEGVRNDQAHTVECFVEEASKICDRVRVDRGETTHTLEAKLDKLSTDLKAWEKRQVVWYFGVAGSLRLRTYRLGGSRHELALEATRTSGTHEHVKPREDDVLTDRKMQLLKSTLVNRKERWKSFQRAITARARVQFMWMLSERNFRGRLLANHKEKKLDLQVEPDATKVSKGREAKTLSGGEKSFSTICLLLSLWDAMGAPVRCLDEFDVFMDSVNREVSMRKMIEAARYSIGKQFILITPGSMGSVHSANDVKIIKMKDPERGQTTITFPG